MIKLIKGITKSNTPMIELIKSITKSNTPMVELIKGMTTLITAIAPSSSKGGGQVNGLSPLTKSQP